MAVIIQTSHDTEIPQPYYIFIRCCHGQMSNVFTTVQWCPSAEHNQHVPTVHFASTNFCDNWHDNGAIGQWLDLQEAACSPSRFCSAGILATSLCSTWQDWPFQVLFLLSDYLLSVKTTDSLKFLPSKKCLPETNNFLITECALAHARHINITEATKQKQKKSEVYKMW